MKNILITAVAFYILWVALYLLYERISACRKNRCQSKRETFTGKTPDDEDIIGKSLFELCHSLPEASTSENPEKAIENHNTFAAPDDNAPMDIDVSLEYENGDETDNSDEEEEKSWLNTGVMLAKGSTFEEMGSAVRTVVHHDAATIEEKEQAGGVLMGIRQTDMFEQLVQSAPGREDIVGEVMNLHLAAYRKRLSERNENPDGAGRRTVPDDFDIKNFV